MFENRSDKLEIMDDLDFSDPVVFQTLKELKIINHWLGGNAVSLKGLQRLITLPGNDTLCLHVADLGSGGGDMMMVMAKWAAKRGYKLQLTGIDANLAIVEYARQNTATFNSIEHEQMDVFSTNFRQKEFDIITCTLFTHHFTDDQLIILFKHLKKQAKNGIVINDLHRHWLAYFSIKLLTGLFSRSYMVKYDAPLSVARSFKRYDWKKIFKAAGITNYTIRWCWAFRWLIVIDSATGEII